MMKKVRKGIQGLTSAHNWRQELASNGPPPTIYPDCHAGGPISGWTRKKTKIGHWHKVHTY